MNIEMRRMLQLSRWAAPLPQTPDLGCGHGCGQSTSLRLLTWGRPPQVVWTSLGWNPTPKPNEKPMGPGLKRQAGILRPSFYAAPGFGRDDAPLKLNILAFYFRPSVEFWPVWCVKQKILVSQSSLICLLICLFGCLFDCLFFLGVYLAKPYYIGSVFGKASARLPSSRSTWRLLFWPCGVLWAFFLKRWGGTGMES